MTQAVLTAALRLTKIAALCCLLVSATLAGYFLATSPVAFQKSAAIRFVDDPDWQLDDRGEPADIAAIVSAIPYGPPGDMVYEVHPRQKYRATIEQGGGNCSNLAFGLAYELNRKGCRYRIVHLMPPAGFLAGEGHTVVEMHYQWNGQACRGIVDLLEGGIPTTGGKPLSLADLRAGSLDNPAIVTLNEHHDAASPYYGEFLDGSVVGVIRDEEAAEYFSFVETIYVPLGHARLEKFVYDGLAIVLGYYPAIEVATADRERLFADELATRSLALGLLYATRAGLALAGCWLVLLSVSTLLTLYQRVRRTSMSVDSNVEEALEFDGQGCPSYGCKPPSL